MTPGCYTVHASTNTAGGGRVVRHITQLKRGNLLLFKLNGGIGRRRVYANQRWRERENDDVPVNTKKHIYYKNKRGKAVLLRVRGQTRRGGEMVGD